ncbi:hypothetical protein H6P81_014703 [Aristolochia fimbriata]|uniref:Uncharacterized protein n=1 Tax=Aristolochia fimbriata TaxID=158543 RepID=A0AAV7E3F3_ARIFI|nr:hypothetical protein H6P81_014703 [Aristolochia fimbriata]
MIWKGSKVLPPEPMGRRLGICYLPDKTESGICSFPPFSAQEYSDLQLRCLSCIQDMASEIRIENMDSGTPCSSSKSFSLETNEIAQIKDAKNCIVFDSNPLGPKTPLPERGNVIALAGSETPLTSISASSTSLRLTSSGSDGNGLTGPSPDVSTPKNHVFDPFAPGPDELIHAPRKKPLEESRSRVARRLVFDSDCNFIERFGDEESEESLLEAIYESILDVVLSKQVTEIPSKNFALGCSSFSVFQTPRHLPPLTGFADTCPGAPMKPLGGSKTFTHTSIILQFGRIYVSPQELCQQFGCVYPAVKDPGGGSEVQGPLSQTQHHFLGL